MTARSWNGLPLGLVFVVLTTALGAVAVLSRRADEAAQAIEGASRPQAADVGPEGRNLVEVGLEEDGSHIYRSRIGRVVLPARPAAEDETARRGVLMRCVAHAAAAGLDRGIAEPWRWLDSRTTGGHLVSADEQLLVLPDAVLYRRALPARDTAAERTAVGAAAEKLVAAIRRSEDVSPWMAGALADLLGRLDDEAGRPHLAELDAQFARRVVASEGWLQQVAPQADARTRRRVESALAASVRIAPAEVHGEIHAEGHAGGGISLTRLADAWGSHGTVLRTPDATIFSRVPPHPMDAGSRMDVLRNCRVIAVLPEGSDLLSDPGSVAEATEVRLVLGKVELAAWSAETGFRSDAQAWRTHFPAPKPNYLRDGWPPHVPIAGPDGRLHGVALPDGVLVPVGDGSDEEAERFLSDAARLLPDAARLDLLQQYFLRYVSDSPDVTQPYMIGCEAFHDEIHQTARQILDTCAGGICRGDCDDVAEFIHTIARRQGKLAHVVNLPGHLAAVWGEQHGDEWRVYVMQSGPSHEYRHAKLPQALAAAYLDLDPNAPLDLNGLNVSLRFDGQNTRDAFRLSWRIFGDVDYARTMIDVQADWNRMTLLRAEQKMLRVLAAGDDSNANFGELAGICSWTDQMEKAIRYDLETLKRRTEPESRLLLGIELAGHYLEAKQREKAEALVEDILTRQLPALVPRLGLRALVIGTRIADEISDELPLLAARALAQTAETKIEGIGGSLVELLPPGGDPKQWRGHGENEALQDLMDEYAGSALAVLQELEEPGQRGHPDVARMLAPLLVWLREHLFDGVTDPEQIATSWNYLTGVFAAASGRDVVPDVAAAPLPKTTKGVDHAALARSSGKSVIFSWAHASPWFACNELGDLVAEKEVRPDEARVKLLARLIDEGEAAAVRLGIHGPDADGAVRKARIRIALLTKNETDLRRLLREVKAFDDRYLYESIASALGWASIHLEYAWWQKAFQIWVDEVDNRVNYFNVVWRALGVGASNHALHVADVAAARYPDDKAIQEETRHLRRHLGVK